MGTADRLFSEIIRARGRCENCNETDYLTLQCAHIIPRRYSVTRTDERNAWCLCWFCHRRFTDHVDEHMDFVDRTIGRELFLELKREALSGRKVDWRTEVLRLRSRLRELKAAA